VIHDRGKIIDANNQFADMVGYDQSELIGQSAMNFIAPQSRELVQNKIASGFQGAYKAFAINKNGTVIPVECQVKSIQSDGHSHRVVAIRDITKQIQSEISIKKSREQLRNLAERLNRIREEERTSISRKIHDDLGQLLSALKMDLCWIKRNPNIDKDICIDKINSVIQLTDSAIQCVKSIASKLRPILLDDLGLIPTLESEVDEFRKRYSIECKLNIDVLISTLPDEMTILIYRVVQESLTNVATHSKAKNVIINIKYLENKRVSMEIKDDGVGITEEQIDNSNSLGLVGMRERVISFNGDMKISGKKNEGTKVSITFPTDKLVV